MAWLDLGLAGSNASAASTPFANYSPVIIGNPGNLGGIDQSGNPVNATATATDKSPGHLDSLTGQAGTTGSKTPLIIGGIVILSLAGVGWYLWKG